MMPAIIPTAEGSSSCLVIGADWDGSGEATGSDYGGDGLGYRLAPGTKLRVKSMEINGKDHSLLPVMW